MKVCIVQPKYSVDYTDSQALFDWEMAALDQCDPSMDLIVFPESCDVPALAHSREDFLTSATQYTPPLLEKAAQTAKRCDAVLFINCTDLETGYRNTTFAFDRQGNLAGKYDKEHLTASEVVGRKRDSGYSFAFSTPTILTIDGLRYGFLTCYDFYFYEAFANIARNHVDIVIGCSHQRSDTHLALEIMSQFLAYNTNAYVVRSSVSMDENSQIGGASMVVAPTGQILLHMQSRVGMACVDIDPKAKYYKPAGFGNPPAAHYEYVELGRRPWKYRPAGSAIVAYDAIMAYPRICAHRGFSAVAPENSMAAFGAAIAMGAEEIAFDLRHTADGQIVCLRDEDLSRVSNGEGLVSRQTYEQLLQYDFGSKFGAEFADLRIVRLEEILHKFAGHAVMNLHLKSVPQAADATVYLERIVALIDRYDCRRHVYFTTDDPVVLGLLRQIAPDVCRCFSGSEGTVDAALAYGCQKIQLQKDRATQQMIDRAHANDLRCNVSGVEDTKEAEDLLALGVDTILTRNYHQIARVVSCNK